MVTVQVEVGEKHAQYTEIHKVLGTDDKTWRKEGGINLFIARV